MTTTATPTMPGPATSFDRDRAPLDDAAQALIDARLETIERMLFGQTPRADRLAIVREVESQIHELLAGRDPSDTDRDAVIAALSRLDPPEAYLPDEVGELPRVVRPLGHLPRAGLATVSGPLGLPNTPTTVIGKTGGILGIIAVVLILPTVVMLYIAFQNNTGIVPFVIFSILCLLVDLLGLLAVVLSAVDRLRSAWSVVGLTAGVVGLLMGLAGTMFSLLEFLG